MVKEFGFEALRALTPCTPTRREVWKLKKNVSNGASSQTNQGGTKEF